MEKVGANEFDFSQGLSQNGISRSCSVSKYGIFLLSEGIINVILKYPKADPKYTFLQIGSFLPPRVYCWPMTYICNHSTVFVANGYNG